MSTVNEAGSQLPKMGLGELQPADITTNDASSEDELDEALAEVDDEPGPSTVPYSAAKSIKVEPASPLSSNFAPGIPSGSLAPAGLRPESSWSPSTSAGPSRPPPPVSSSSPFKVPPNPQIPQDLSLIAEMVGSHQVVGALPPLHMTAAEKRRLVEESIRKGKGKALETDSKPHSVELLRGTEEESDDSDSSSEFMSDIDEDEKPTLDEPMTEEEHADIKAGLDKLVNGNSLRQPPGVEAEDDSDDSSEYTTDDDEDIAEIGAEILQGATTGKGKARLEELLDDDEDGGGGGPIVSTNEAPLPPVPQPPIRQLPTSEKLTLAGDVVSWMKEKKVEAWLEKASVDVAAVDHTTEAGEVVEKPEAPTPSFNSAGTVVIRAMQERPGVDGWLEEGSVLCWQGGRVLGSVADTFGPLTSPFYLVRLPPPPHPYPTTEDLTSGVRIFYPSNPSYRRFVDMHAVRDPRFKGSDASNFHDEEVGEDEMEWSDDEAEAEARRRKKNKRSGSNASRGGGGGARGRDRGYSGQPVGPSGGGGSHFDYQPSANDEDAESLYGGVADEADGWSDAGSSYSTASGRGRAMPEPYEMDDEMSSSRARDHAERERGRGQGRQRGRGRGGYEGGRGGGPRGGGRGGRGGRGNDHRRSGPSGGEYRGNGLPPRPVDGYSPTPQQSYQAGGYSPSSGGQYSHQWNQPPPPQQYSPYAQPQAAPGGFFPAPMSSWAPPSPTGNLGGGPAINPKFAAAAAQYSQLLQNPGWGGQGGQHYSE